VDGAVGCRRSQQHEPHSQSGQRPRAFPAHGDLQVGGRHGRGGQLRAATLLTLLAACMAAGRQAAAPAGWWAGAAGAAGAARRRMGADHRRTSARSGCAASGPAPCMHACCTGWRGARARGADSAGKKGAIWAAGGPPLAALASRHAAHTGLELLTSMRWCQARPGASTRARKARSPVAGVVRRKIAKG